MVIYIYTKIQKNIFDSIKATELKRWSYQKLPRGIIPRKRLVELWFLFSAHHPMMLYINTKFCENILIGIRVLGLPTIWITVGQGPTELAVGVGGGCLDIFTLIHPFFPLSPSLR